MPQENYFFEKAIMAAISAGNAVMCVYSNSFKVEIKDDKSPVTEADLRSDKIIAESLAECGLPVLSEEGGICSFEERKKWKYFWLVDPLDGTKEFINRNGEFTVNIALIKKDSPVMGIIYVPAEDVIYFASENTGAYRLNSVKSFGCKMSLEKLTAHAKKLPFKRVSEKYVIVASRSHINKQTSDYIENIKQTNKETEIISRGSSLKFCQVAEGKADVYPRFGTTMEWDTAAGHAIAKFSGCNVLQAGKTEELKYNKRDLRNPDFIVSA